MKFMGIDTETINGFCRLIGLSNGKYFFIRSYEDISNFFRLCSQLNLLAYNADYDVQAMMKWLPKEVQLQLVKGIPVSYDGIFYEYIPKKFFRFDNNAVYDVHQYYGTSLKKASEKYLDRSKLDVDAANINEENIYTAKVIDYCIEDARLCFDLFSMFYGLLPPELKHVKPLSTAFYSYKYFKKELIANRLTPATNKLVKEAYHGGRFEILQRTYAKNVKVYDITSAYPYEICKLRSMVGARMVRMAIYIPDASYGFYDVEVDITDKFVSPLVLKNKGLCLYPVGKFRATITKEEYEAIKHFDHKIISAVHIYCKSEYPFKEKMEYVFHQKQTSKNPLVWKLIANSLYGKTCQSIRHYLSEVLEDEPILKSYTAPDGTSYYQYIDMGNSNFVYASVITANTRLRMYEAIKKWPNDILAVQTDSLISKRALPLPLTDKLGDWKLEEWDEAYLIGSGVYFYKMDGVWKAKFRGFNFQGTVVEDILDKLLNSDETYISFESLKRFSIQEAARLHNEELSNQILTVTKKLNINFDRKRVWLGNWESGKEIRTKSISSLAIPVFKDLI